MVGTRNYTGLKTYFGLRASMIIGRLVVKAVRTLPWLGLVLERTQRDGGMIASQKNEGETMELPQFLESFKRSHEEAWDLFLKVLFWVGFITIGLSILIWTGIQTLWFIFIPVLVVFLAVIITGLSVADIDW